MREANSSNFIKLIISVFTLISFLGYGAQHVLTAIKLSNTSSSTRRKAEVLVCFVCIHRGYQRNDSVIVVCVYRFFSVV